MKEGHTLSAYLVNKDTIDLLVSAAIEPRFLRAHSSGVTIYALRGEIVVDTDAMSKRVVNDPYSPIHDSITLGSEDGNLLGRELAAANYRSLMARYPKDHTEEGCLEYGAAYFYRPVSRADATLYDVLGAISCYRYQSCERINERTGFWGYFCQYLERSVVSELPEVKWEYTRPETESISIFDLARGGNRA